MEQIQGELIDSTNISHDDINNLWK